MEDWVVPIAGLGGGGFLMMGFLVEVTIADGALVDAEAKAGTVVIAAVAVRGGERGGGAGRPFLGATLILLVPDRYSFSFLGGGGGTMSSSTALRLDGGSASALMRACSFFQLDESSGAMIFLRREL
jgi:hypothetical protein